MKSLLILLMLTGCSTTRQMKTEQANVDVTNSSLKKVRPLANSQVADFYQSTIPSMSPALQDESLDRYNQQELEGLTGVDDPLLQISLHCHKGNFSTAFKIASAVFDRYLKVAAYWNQVANCHLNSGSFRKALLFYNKSLEVKADYIPALNNIGVMYTRQGQDQKALIAFERATKLGRFSKTPRYNLARLYLMYGLAESAIPLFQSLSDESPQDVDLLNALGTSFFILSDYQQALSYFQKIPQSEWRKPEYGLNIAVTLKSLGRQDDAKKLISSIESSSNSNLKRYQSSVQNILGVAE
jgi:tetratricopeptide (TPR) repeat protein